MADWADVEKRLPQDDGARSRSLLLNYLRTRTSFKPQEVLAKVVVLVDGKGRRMLWGYGSTGIQNLYLGPAVAECFPADMQRSFPLKKHSARTTYLGAYEGPTVEIRGPEDLKILAPLETGIPAETSVSALSREAVESAMDAYDRYLATGEHGDVFDKFGDPRDYWVRSTKARTNRVYPTKQIVAFVRGKTDLNGGWGQKADAAARLHNSGFIIVDKADQPVPAPDRYDHLIRGAERIRLCALNYWLLPGRERFEEAVTIHVGTLADDLCMNQALRNVWQSLRGSKLQEMAQVPPPHQEGEDERATTTFTYRLEQNGSSPKMKPETSGKQPSATNMILYGPPGTGKTFATAFEAVRLCLGDDAAAPLSNDRDALMEAYRRLVGEGRIEFVTFHQSFSYEDFVEGLRPTTDNAKADDEVGDAPASGGFSLKPHAGMFKQISERARLDTGDGSADDRLDRSRHIFKIALGERSSQEDRVEYGLQNNLIHNGWGENIDWSDERYESWSEIRSKLEEVQGAPVSSHSGHLVCNYSFRNDLQIDDYVVVSDGRDRFRAFGKVTSEYFFDKDAAFHPHRRRVDWLWIDDGGAERIAFYPKTFRRHSFYKLDDDAIDWDGLESVVLRRDAVRPAASARDFVLIIDEINRANISKVFGELITLLEVDKRLGCQNEVRLRLPYSGTSFGVPSNLHIIGTMNTADRSIALLDTALRRRFTFRELMPDPTRLDENVDGVNLRKLLAALNDRIEYLFDREHQIGHAYFTACRSLVDIEEVMRHKVIPLLSEYFYDDWSKVAAVLGDRPFAAQTHFLDAKRLVAPAGLLEDEMGEEKVRWSVKMSFDFSEFEAQ